MNILLDYFFKITSISPTPQASTAFLKQVCVVAKPKTGQEGNVGEIFLCTSMAQVLARTDNQESQQLFDAGMSRVHVLLADDLDLSAFLVGHESDFFTILISSDFDKDDVIPTQASGTITVTNFANLISDTDDVVTIEGTALTAQAGAATPGTGTFQADGSNDATAASLAAQINAHPALSPLVVATVVGAVVTVQAKNAGSGGNQIDVAYTDNDTNVGITLAGLSGGKLSGGDGLYQGAFRGVIGISSDDDAFLADQAAIENRCAFHVDPVNGAKNMFFAFGEMLSNSLAWRNQQYITTPFADDVNNGGAAEVLFEDRISFVISDSQYGNRLAMFCAGGKAIVAPYVKRNLEIDMQSKALSYVSGNQPAYTKTHASLLEDELQKVIDLYIERQDLTKGVVEIKLEQEDFVASGYINVAEPKALWRIFAEMRSTLT